MKIYSVFDDKFRCYGRVIEGYDTSELVKTLAEVTPLPDGVDYVAEQPELQGLPITGELSSRFYGGMPIQMGWCNGHSTKLNCLEYHRCSEINIGSDDFVLLVGKLYDVDPEDGLFDTSKVEAFLVPAGVVVEMYETTLHYAPCSAAKDAGFRVVITLPKGTNGSKPSFVPGNREDTLMTACNKWLLAHPESSEAKNGAVIGLKGWNVDIADDLP